MNYRLAGCDTPEEYTNVCGGFTEIDLARAASRRLVELLNTSDWQIQSLGEADRYGRVLANLYVNGDDVGDILVREGLARYWPDGPEFWCQ
ncbi:thermonuclease family protein [Gymnodinialimonas hymeniacidonis]|uniref:thermonuclease family protein n=1 Tax=Gymnodinialimonas hymeniacidonis TaxID=3126508 RepID=UPI0034C5D453